MSIILVETTQGHPAYSKMILEHISLMEFKDHTIIFERVLVGIQGGN